MWSVLGLTPCLFPALYHLPLPRLKIRDKFSRIYAAGGTFRSSKHNPSNILLPFRYAHCLSGSVAGSVMAAVGVHHASLLHGMTHLYFLEWARKRSIFGAVFVLTPGGFGQSTRDYLRVLPLRGWKRSLSVAAALTSLYSVLLVKPPRGIALIILYEPGCIWIGGTYASEVCEVLFVSWSEWETCQEVA